MYFKIQVFLFCFSLFGYGLISSFVTDPNLSRIITVPYRFVIICCSLLALINYLIEKNKRPIFSLKLLLTIVFVSMYSFRIFYDLIYNSLLVRDHTDYWLFWFFICLIPGLSFLILVQENQKYKEKYLKYSWILLFAIGCIGIFKKSQIESMTIAGRLSFEALNPISLGHFGCSLALISLFRLLVEKKITQNQNKINKNILITSTIIGVYVVVMAASRGPIVSFLISALFLFCSFNSNSNSKTSIIYTMLILASIVFAFSSFASSDSDSAIFSRIQSTLDGNEFNNTSSFLTRPQILAMANELIVENLLFGFGLEIPNLGYPHNLLVEAFLSTGIIGGCIFSWIFFHTLWQAVLICFSRNLVWSWLAIFYIQYAVGSMFSGSLYASSQFWYLLFAMIAIGNNHKQLKPISISI